MKRLFTLMLLLAAFSCTRYDDLPPAPSEEPLNADGRAFMDALGESPGWEKWWSEAAETGTPQPNRVLFSGNWDTWEYIVPLVEGKLIRGLAFFPATLNADSTQFMLDRPEIIARDSFPGNFKTQRLLRSDSYAHWRNKGLKVNMTLPPISVKVPMPPRPRLVRYYSLYEMVVYCAGYRDPYFIVELLSENEVWHIIEDCRLATNRSLKLSSPYCYEHQAAHDVAWIDQCSYHRGQLQVYSYVAEKQNDRFYVEHWKETLLNSFIWTLCNAIGGAGSAAQAGFKLDIKSINEYGSGYGDYCNPDAPTGGGGTSGGGESGGGGGSGGGTTGGETPPPLPEDESTADVTVDFDVSSNKVEISQTYRVMIRLSGRDLGRVAQVNYKMDRKGRSTGWKVIGELGGHGGNHYEFVRKAIAPGFWYITAEVVMDDYKSLQCKNVMEVEEQFPSADKFLNNPAFRNHLTGTLWAATCEFARNNQSSHAVREHGCLIYMEPDGSYSLGDVVPGAVVYLTGPGVKGTTEFDYNESYPDPREPLRYAVGSMHTHYPMTYAVPGMSRDAGISPDDRKSELPGLGYDYQGEQQSGDPEIGPMSIFTYGPDRRPTPR